MNGYAKRREEKRQQIIRTAIKLFQRYGFKRVSVLEVAKTAGVSQVTVYKYFENKHLLIRACVREFLAAKAEEYGRLLTSDDPFPVRLAALISDKVSVVNSFDGELLAEIYDGDRDFLEEILELKNKLIREVTTPFLMEGRERGYIRDDVSDEALTVFIDVIRTGILSSSSYKAYIRREPKAFEVIQNLAIQAFTTEPR